MAGRNRMQLLPNAVRVLSERQPVRLVVQATLAATLAYGLSRTLGLQDESWAVISALFTVQANVGSTLGMAVTRFCGAIVGLAIALAAIMVIGIGPGELLASFLLSMLAISIVTAFKPELNYALVTAPILILSPGGDVIAEFWSTGAAVALGAATGALCAAFVLPLTAHRSANWHLARATGEARSVLEAVVATLAGADRSDLSAARARLRAELDAAETCIGQSKRHRWPNRKPPPLPRKILAALQGLTHTLAFLDDLEVRRLPDERLGSCAEPLRTGFATIAERLGAIASRIDGQASNRRKIDTAAFDEIDATLASIRERAIDGIRDRGEAERVVVVCHALGHAVRCIRDLDDAATAQAR